MLWGHVNNQERENLEISKQTTYDARREKAASNGSKVPKWEEHCKGEVVGQGLHLINGGSYNIQQCTPFLSGLISSLE